MLPWLGGCAGVVLALCLRVSGSSVCVFGSGRVCLARRRGVLLGFLVVWLLMESLVVTACGSWVPLRSGLCVASAGAVLRVRARTRARLCAGGDAFPFFMVLPGVALGCSCSRRFLGATGV